MNKKIWLIYSIIIIIIGLCINTVFMYWSDTYSVEHTKRINFYTEPNANVLKVSYILENKHKYDSFIFGSSRISAINPLKINNGNYYNMTYSEGIPHEHLLNIKLFLNSGVKIKNLLIGLDEFSYKVSFDKHQSQGLTKSHYLATNTNKFTYMKDYFFRFPLSEDRNSIMKKIKNNQQYLYYNIYEQEAQYINKKIIISDYNSIKHLNSEVFKKPIFYTGNLMNETIKDIKDIKDICNKYKIHCKFFINPIHKTTYKYLDKKQFNLFKTNLRNIISYYDFSLLNDIMNNNFYWNDTSHYRDIIGDLMINRIYSNKSNDVIIYKKSHIRNTK